MITKSRTVTIQDFVKEEYIGKDPEDYEFRDDGRIVRKDRWEQGIRRIVSILGLNDREFEIDDVVSRIENLKKVIGGNQ